MGVKLGVFSKNFMELGEVHGMGDVKVTFSLSDAQKQDLLLLYKNEWWSNTRTAQDIDSILAGSTFIVGLVSLEEEKLIAFARVLSDKFQFAYIYDVIVDSECRKKGIGKILLNTVLEQPIVKSSKYVELVCRKEKVSFYEQFGFTTEYGGSVSMRRHVN